MAHTRKLDDIDLIELKIEIEKKTHLIESIESVARKVRNLIERLHDDSEILHVAGNRPFPAVSHS